jgi:hypothetical protein
MTCACAWHPKRASRSSSVRLSRNGRSGEASRIPTLTPASVRAKASVSTQSADTIEARPKRARAGDGPNARIRWKGAARTFAPLAPGDCSDSSNPAVSRRSNRCAKTAPFAEKQESRPARLLVVRRRRLPGRARGVCSCTKGEVGPHEHSTLYAKCVRLVRRGTARVRSRGYPATA